MCFLINKSEFNWLLGHIDNHLENQYTNNKLSPGLHYGDCGYFLYLLETGQRDKFLERIKPLKIPSRLDQELKDIFQLRSLSLSSGIIGRLWLLCYCQRYYNIDFYSEIKRLFPYLKIFVKACLENLNFDFLHGAGGAICVINIMSSPHFKSLEKEIKGCNHELMYGLVRATTTDLSFSSHKTHPEINYLRPPKLPRATCTGVAHGVAGLLQLLIENYRCRHEEVTGQVIDMLVNYLTRIMRIPVSDEPMFPDWVLHDKNKFLGGGKLAWCYGDIGICNALLTYYQLRPSKFDKRVYSRLIELSKLENTNIMDNAVCHGVAGLSLQFFICGKMLNNKSLIEAALRWLQRILNEYQTSSDIERLCGAWSRKEKLRKETISLLDGTAGIALVVNEIINPSRSPWYSGIILPQLEKNEYQI